MLEPGETYVGVGDCDPGFIVCDEEAHIVEHTCPPGTIWNKDNNTCTCPDETHCPDYLEIYPETQDYPNECFTFSISSNYKIR